MFHNGVMRYYREVLDRDGAMLFSLIDPDKLFLEKGAKVAKESLEAGADAILVGGSIGAQGTLLDESIKMIKESIGGTIPIVLYPGNISGLSPFADALYFMHMLNSRDVYWLSTAQIQAAPVVARMKIEAIPTAYVIIEPGRAVGWIGNANAVPRERGDLAAACALAARYSGSKVVITDAGSGAPKPAPAELVSMVAKACGDDVLYFNAGGVRTPAQATACIKAGAHGIHVGNAFEASSPAKMKAMAQAVKKEGRKRA